MAISAAKLKKLGYTKFDAADYLHSAEDLAGFLSASIQHAQGDPTLVLHAFNTALRAQNRNMAQLARETGITRSGLYEALSGRRNPSFGTVLSLLGAMGMTLAVTPTK